MFITVLICTRNRAPDLRISLETLLTPADLATRDWEVIVVDNDSSDETSAVCRGYEAEFPGHFRFLLEPKKGKSNALNAGIAAARGDVIAMTDDDVLVPPGYLNGVRRIVGDRS